jgi:hypothetical protein
LIPHTSPPSSSSSSSTASFHFNINNNDNNNNDHHHGRDDSLHGILCWTVECDGEAIRSYRALLTAISAWHHNKMAKLEAAAPKETLEAVKFGGEAEQGQQAVQLMAAFLAGTHELAGTVSAVSLFDEHSDSGTMVLQHIDRYVNPSYEQRMASYQQLVMSYRMATRREDRMWLLNAGEEGRKERDAQLRLRSGFDLEQVGPCL